MGAATELGRATEGTWSPGSWVGRLRKRGARNVAQLMFIIQVAQDTGRSAWLPSWPGRHFRYLVRLRGPMTNATYLPRLTVTTGRWESL